MAVYRYLSAYTKAPNRDNETFYLFSNHFNYGAMLSSYTATDIGSLDVNNYRVNEGKIKLTGTHLLVDFRKVVYFELYDYDDFTDTITNRSYYFVERAYIESGFYVYDVKPDIWANEIANAAFSQFHITRCNRELGNGVYDEVKTTKNYRIDYYGTTINTPISDYCVVFSAAVVTQASWFGNNPLTQTFLFYLPLEDISSAAIATFASMDILEKVRFIVGGMHSTNTTGLTDAKMEVLRCWILPKAAVSASSIGLSSIKTKSAVTGNGDYTFSNVALVKYWEKLLTFDFTTFLGTYLNTRYPDWHIEFGTRGGHTLPLTRFTSNKNVYAVFYITSGGVRVQVEQGNNIQDISAAFELDINVNNQIGTATQELAKNAAKLIALYALSSKAYAKGGAPAATLTAVSGVLGMQQGSAANAPSNFNGDATTTYCLNDPDYVMYPFVVAATPSNENEDENAYFKGANYDVYNADFATIETYTHLGSVATALQREGTLIAADDFLVRGVSKEAEALFREEFKRGVWLKVI